jgi:NAD+ synthase
MYDLVLPKPQQTIDHIISFIKETYQRANKKQAVIAVSGGIDSALSLTLVSEALGPKNVWPLFLPFKEQSIADSEAIAAVNRVPKSHWRTVQIDPIVEALEKTVSPHTSERMGSLRKGNAMARARMMVVYDTAKELDALVCGTENKSEKYLAYFTRFGDEASDIEPIVGLYKTQVRQLASFLNLPEQFVTKAPSAGLWDGQTDEDELGFSYEQADQVIEGFLQESQTTENITQLAAVTISEKSGVELAIVESVLKRIKSTHFKHQVPYTLHD